MEHHIETLVKNRNGYAGICPCCNHYNIAFKNMLFNLNDYEFVWFRSLLVQKKMMCDFPTSHGKEILLSTPLPNFSILLTHYEIEQLLDMMNSVHLIVEARKIVDDLTKG